MSKPIRLSQERAMTDMELLTSLHLSALKYNQYADKKLLYIYRANTQNAPYENYEVFFGRENFIHLVGFKRAKINAIEFFDKCCFGTLQLHEVSFKESRKATSSKLDIITQLLDYRHAKVYKIGNADLVTEKNRFELGVGNYAGLIGFDQRKPRPSLPVPVTILKKPITDYVSKPENVLAILSKGKHDRYYDTVIGCVSSGLDVNTLPQNIQAKLSPSLSTIDTPN